MYEEVTIIKKFKEKQSSETEQKSQPLPPEKPPKAKLGISELNYAVRNALSGMAQCCAMPDKVMRFLKKVYNPFGIEILPYDKNGYNNYYTVTQIARLLDIYSDSGRPHGHAVSSIITKLGKLDSNAIAIPYGLVGVSLRYDKSTIKAVWNWVKDNNFPETIPHLYFEYHVWYKGN
jgi:hypothetical protein